MRLTEVEKRINQKPELSPFDMVIKVRAKDIKQIKELLKEIPYELPLEHFEFTEYKKSKINLE